MCETFFSGKNSNVSDKPIEKCFCRRFFENFFKEKNNFCVSNELKKKHFRKKKYMWNRLENLFADHYLMCENFSRKRNLNCIILCQTKWKIYIFFKFIWESKWNIFFAGEFYSFWVNFLFICQTKWKNISGEKLNLMSEIEWKMCLEKFIFLFL